MPETIACPDCGHANPAGSTRCSNCNFPLIAEAVDSPAPVAAAAPGPPAPPEPAPAPPEPAPEDPPIVIPRPLRPIRPRPPRAINPLQTQLWLMSGVLATLCVIGIAVQGFMKSNTPQPIAGSSEEQLKRADAARAAIASDSTNVAARVELGDVYYDTGNWPEAIVNYRAAIRRDSTLTKVMVDLGVAYYNSGFSRDAERMFLLALHRDPHLPQALFNLGVVAEARGDWKQAVEYYHRAMQSGPPEAMKETLMTHLQSVMEKAGMKPPPLPDGAAGK